VHLARQLPMIGSPGNGLHAPGRKKPQTGTNKGIHAARAGRGIRRPRSATAGRAGLLWRLARVLGDSTLGIDTNHGMTPCGVLLDPPYAHELREKRMYREDEAGSLGGRRALGDRERRQPTTADRSMRLRRRARDAVELDLRGGGSRRAEARTARLERIWFSPHCLPVDDGDLFARARGDQLEAEA
jgi:hypothetical protein